MTHINTICVVKVYLNRYFIGSSIFRDAQIALAVCMCVYMLMYGLWVIECVYLCVCMCVCMCRCVCVSVCLSVSEPKISRTEAPIYTRFLLNGCLPQWLKSYWSWWPWVKCQDHSDVISIFSVWFTVNFPTVDLSSLMSDQNEIWYVAWICPWYIATFGLFLVFQTSFGLQFFLLTFDSHHLCYVHAGYLFVTDPLSKSTTTVRLH